MIIFILKLFYIQAAFLTLSDDNLENQILNKFITAFNDKKTVQKWIKSRKIRILCKVNLMFEIISKVKDILTVISSKTYKDVKSLIMNTYMNLPKLGYPYLETFNILSSVKRILLINEKTLRSKLKKYNNLKRFDEIIYEEYDQLYHNLEKTIVSVGLNYSFTETQKSFSQWIKKRLGSKIEFIESSSVKRNLKDALEIIQNSRFMLSFILPINYEKPVYVKTDSVYFESSKICFEDEIYFFIREQSTMLVCQDEYMLQNSIGCSRKQSNLNQVDIKEYMNKTFLCNKTATEVLITLFHYYSEIKCVETTYEIILKKFNEYQIKWTFPKNPSIEAIKDFWFKQEISDLSTRKIIHKFGFIINYGIEYSTEKSHDTEDEPIKTRLILLSCGHQLGFDLIDEFLENFYTKYLESLKCHICRQSISIVGSYNAFVYKCR